MNTNDLITSLTNIPDFKLKLISQELNIRTIGDILEFFPCRYKTNLLIENISDLNDKYLNEDVIIRGSIKSFQKNKVKGGREFLEAVFCDKTSYILLLWFKKIDVIQKYFKVDREYKLKGTLTKKRSRYVLVHPSVVQETLSFELEQEIAPTYNLPTKLKQFGIDSKFLNRFINYVLSQVSNIEENIPANICEKYKLINRYKALMLIHNPTCSQDIHQAQRRLKFEELFFLQLKLLMTKHIRMSKQKGFIMSDITLFNDFFNNHLTFELTNAQKKVLKEIYQDMSSGFQMNRLLQGDVGSGKTIVAFLAMLMALGNGYQVALMAPTEILAEQHYKNICDLCKDLGFHVALLTGSTRTAERKSILYYLSHGFVNILIGTHSLINDQVVYQKLGLVIIDEQHKFGVEQRAKVTNTAAHVLIMTATPIPRTLAMTLYGDLDVSVLNEMPPGRSPVKTIHIYESQRLRAIGLARQQIEKGHQVYFVFPLIEESKKLDLKNLMDGYENIKSYFPNTPISITHGNMLPKDKDIEMQKFVRGETKIMVSTTVIEVGINVPNATVIIIENANRFGLSQLHQLRGRVGRSDFQSFCVLITGVKLSKIGKQRLKAFVDISDGFELSNVDLQLRGEGDIMGNQQSGTVSMKIANLQTDYNILNCARIEALGIIKADPDLDNNPILKKNLEEKLDTNYSNVG